MPDKTPGQWCYEAHEQHFAHEMPILQAQTALPWAALPRVHHAAWEAAAQAAIAHWWRAHEAVICGEEERDDV